MKKIENLALKKLKSTRKIIVETLNQKMEES